jgi:hypothetical protein
MKAEFAQGIIKRAGLIDRKQSKAILAAITSGHEPDLSNICSDDHRKIRNIQRQYARARSEWTQATRPRNLPFYFMIKMKYPEFRWRETENGIIIDCHFQGIKPSLLSLLMDLVPADEIEVGEKRRRSTSLGGIDGRVAEVVFDGMVEEGIVRPSEDTVSRLSNWLRRGLAGDKLTIVSPVCPDYETVDGTSAKHRFTFNGLGVGAGVTGRRLLRSLPGLMQLFRETLGLDCRWIICPGDFEGFSKENTNRLKISEMVFLERIKKSCEAITAELIDGVHCQPFSDLCGGKREWMSRYIRMLGRFEAGEFGPPRGNPVYLDIAASRQSLYDRWYQLNGAPLSHYEPLVIRQGAEYATMGEVVEEAPGCLNPMIIGADHHKMAPFYNYSTKSIPVLYLRRDYE